MVQSTLYRGNRAGAAKVKEAVQAQKPQEQVRQPLNAVELERQRRAAAEGQ